MLDELDMAKFELDCHDIDYDQLQTKRAFRRILDEVRNRTGFDAEGEKLFMQVYPCKNGGCELFVTKITTTISYGDFAKKDITMCSYKTTIYSFSHLDTMLTVCHILEKNRYGMESSAYYTQDDLWHLVLLERVRSGHAKHLGEYSFIEEYAIKKSGSLCLAHIKEHGACIAQEHAVSRLASLVKDID